MMEMKRSMIAVMSVVAIVLALATQARAEFFLHDGESGMGNFDFVAIQWQSGAPLAPPVFRDDTSGQTMSNFGWTQQGNATTAYASFASTDSIDFDVAFVGDDATGDGNYELYGFNGDQMVFNELFWGHGGGGGNSAWNSEYINTSTTPTRAELVSGVPEPSTLVLLGISAISLLSYGWRRRAT
jgi:hypothetical protein